MIAWLLVNRFYNTEIGGRRRVQSKHGKDNKMAKNKNQRVIGMGVMDIYKQRSMFKT